MSIIDILKSGFSFISKPPLTKSLENCLFAIIEERQILINKLEFNNQIISIFPDIDMDQAANIHSIKIKHRPNNDVLTIFHYVDEDKKQIDEVKIEISKNQYKNIESLIHDLEVA